MATQHNFKDEKIKSVASAVLNIVMQHGIREVTPSRVARAAKVSRPWIYKYIGGAKDSLMNFAAEYFGKIYSGLESPVLPGGRKEWIDDEIQTLERNLKYVKEYPWIIPLFYRYKGTQTPLGRSIDKIEAEYFLRKTDQISKAFSVDKDTARMRAEFNMTFKLALAHRWMTSGFHKMKEPKDFIPFVRGLFEQVAKIQK